MSVRPDNRLDDAPMTPVGCGACGAQVLVRKSSWEQTSIQWNADSMSKCQARKAVPRFSRGAGVGSGPGSELLLCDELRTSIEDAARGGRLSVLDEI